MSTVNGNVSSAAAQWYNVLESTTNLSPNARAHDMNLFAKFKEAIQLANIPEMKKVLQEEGVTVTRSWLKFSPETDFDALQTKMFDLSNKYNV